MVPEKKFATTHWDQNRYFLCPNPEKKDMFGARAKQHFGISAHMEHLHHRVIITRYTSGLENCEYSHKWW
jgi:hypothetical protein